MRQGYCRGLFLWGLAVVCLFTGVAYSQAANSVTVSGSVVEAGNNSGLPGANVVVKGTFIGTTTDQAGRFSLVVNHPTPFVLVFRYIGYQTQEITVNGSRSDLRVVLQPQPISGSSVTVTAQLREQELQDVPLAVSVMDEKLLSGTTELITPSELSSYVPGLTGKGYAATGGIYAIRGISTSAFGAGIESSVAILQDGVYNGRPVFTGAGYYDLERIEVLKGPQGTLFGRNASAGVIHVISNKPRMQRDLSIQLSGGNEGYLEGTYVLNYPMSEKFAVRLAGKRAVRDGLRKVTNLDNYSVHRLNAFSNRLSFLYRPSDQVNLTLILQHWDEDNGGSASKAINTDLGTTPDKFAREYELDFKPQSKVKNRSANLQLNWVLNQSTVFHSITAYNYWDLTWLSDIDATPTYVLNFTNPTTDKTFVQEFRLSGKSDRLSWLAAASVFIEKIDMGLGITFSDFILPVLFGLPPDLCDQVPGCRDDASEFSANRGDYVSYAVYGDMTYSLSKQVRVTAGLRYSIDDKKYHTSMEMGNGAFHQVIGGNILGPIGTVDQKKTWRGLQPRVVLDYSPSENVMLYGSYSRGYKSGGFNNYTAGTFDEEINNAFEVGLKSSLVQNRLKVNIAGYLSDYRNLQVQSIVNGVVAIDNAAKVSTKGVEIETSFNVARGFDLIANAAFNDAKYKDYRVPDFLDPSVILDFSGNRPEKSPIFTFSGIAQYVRPISGLGTFFLRVDYTYQTKEYYERANAPELSAEPYGVLNGTVGLQRLFKGLLDISLFGSNLLNVNYVAYAEDPLGGIPVYVPGIPRYIGVRLGLHQLIR